MRFFLAVWLLLITAVSLAPLRAKTALGTVGFWHNPMHFAVFLLTGVLALFGAQSLYARGFRTFMLVAFCATIELLEAVIYRNHIEWRDILIDSLGLFSGWLLVMLVRGPATPRPRRCDLTL